MQPLLTQTDGWMTLFFSYFLLFFWCVRLISWAIALDGCSHMEPLRASWFTFWMGVTPTMGGCNSRWPLAIFVGGMCIYLYNIDKVVYGDCCAFIIYLSFYTCVNLTLHANASYSCWWDENTISLKESSWKILDFTF